MPLNINFLITIPKAVVVSFNIILLSNYLRLAVHRYMDEWIGSFIYVIGDLIDLLMCLVAFVDTSGDENEKALKFIIQYTVNRTCFVSRPSSLISQTCRIILI